LDKLPIFGLETKIKEKGNKREVITPRIHARFFWCTTIRARVKNSLHKGIAHFLGNKHMG
jgi:hypothetical protein